MEILEFEKAIFNISEKEFTKFLKDNLHYKNPSKVTEGIQLIKKLDRDKKDVLIARLERIYERNSVSTEVATYTSLLLAVLLIINSLLGNKYLSLMLGTGILVTVLFPMMKSKELKSDVKYYLSLVERN